MSIPSDDIVNDDATDIRDAAGDTVGGRPTDAVPAPKDVGTLGTNAAVDGEASETEAMDESGASAGGGAQNGG